MATTIDNSPETSAPAPSSGAGTAQSDLHAVIGGGVVCLSLLAIAFWSNLEQFVRVWSRDDNYSHGFLVPFISGYFAYQAYRKGPLTVRSGALLGSTLLGLAIVGRLATVVIPVGFIGDLSFLIGLAGLCVLLLGTNALRRYWFALFFLIFMIPLPVALYALIASPLQLLASQIASVVLNSTGVPVLAEGNMMTLPGGVRMFVAEACSGMRQLTGFLALTAAVAYMTPRPVWYRLILVVSALPIAITANVARVTLTGYIMHFFDPKYAAGTFHTVEGLLMMGFGLTLLCGECKLLDQLTRLISESPTAASAGDDASTLRAPGEDAHTSSSPTDEPSHRSLPVPCA
jgi:exosortase